MYNLLHPYLSDLAIAGIGAALSFIVTYIIDVLFIKGRLTGLPVDHGKVVTREDGTQISINAESNNKVTSIGTVFFVYFILFSLLFTPISYEYAAYVAVAIFTMVIGYLDDAVFGAKKGLEGKELAKYEKKMEYLNGVLELVGAFVPALMFALWNDTDIHIFRLTVHVPFAVYILLAMLLIWVSVNAVNGTDGVDGLSGTVYLINIATYLIIFHEELGDYTLRGLILQATVLAYLFHNFGESRILMGDAGSRPLGFFLALFAMKSGHPISFLLISSIFIFDGFLGVVKLAILRIYEKLFGHEKKEALRKKGLFKIAFPFHVHLKTNCGWEKKKVVCFFIILSLFVAVLSVFIFWLFMSDTLL